MATHRVDDRRQRPCFRGTGLSEDRPAGSVSGWLKTRLRFAGARHPTVHRPTSPARDAAAPRGARHQPAMVLASRHPGPLRGGRRARVGGQWTRPRPLPGHDRTRSGCRLLAADRRFIQRLRLAHGDLEDYLTGDRWYQTLGPDAPRQIAYFSPEFGIAAVLPQYSGGLGILAGDHLKTASDLGVPIIGVGLLYRHGYFRQLLSREGWQQERYPITDPDELPLRLLREDDGEVARVDVGLPMSQRRTWSPRSGSRTSVGCRCCCSTPTSRPTMRWLPLRAGDHRPAVRRQHGAPAAPGGAPGVRRDQGDPRLLPHHGGRAAGGVPHQRGPRRLPGHRAHPGVRSPPGSGFRRRPRAGAGRHRLHDAHPRPGRDRQVPAGPDRRAVRPRRHDHPDAGAQDPGARSRELSRR